MSKSLRCGAKPAGMASILYLSDYFRKMCRKMKVKAQEYFGQSVNLDNVQDSNTNKNQPVHCPGYQNVKKIPDTDLIGNCPVFQFVTRTHWDFMSELCFQCMQKAARTFCLLHLFIFTSCKYNYSIKSFYTKISSNK